jgi:hypothetical protein
MDPISDDTGVPAPQVQDLLEKVEIDETVAECKFPPPWVQDLTTFLIRERLACLLDGLLAEAAPYDFRLPSRIQIGLGLTTWRKLLDTYRESEPYIGGWHTTQLFPQSR